MLINKPGFTLIEVLLALAVIAIAISALLKNSASTIKSTNRLKEKTIQHWVARQAINQIQLKSLMLRPNLPTTKVFPAFNHNWYFQARMTATKLSNIQKVTIKVSPQRQGPYGDPLVAFYYEQ